LEGVSGAENDDWRGKLDHEAISASFRAALGTTATGAWCRVIRQRSAEAVRHIAEDADWVTTWRAQAQLAELGFGEIEDRVRWTVFRKP
jgi:hypothetical protein